MRVYLFMTLHQHNTKISYYIPSVIFVGILPDTCKCQISIIIICGLLSNSISFACYWYQNIKLFNQYIRIGGEMTRGEITRRRNDRRETTRWWNYQTLKHQWEESPVAQRLKEKLKSHASICVKLPDK